jgi:hypothetical protein
MGMGKMFALLTLALSASFASARVCVYQHAGFQGNSICWESWDRGSDNLSNTGMNDQISSIEITDNEAVTVCEHAYYQGQCRTYYSNVYNLSGDFNDIISSVSINGNNQPQPEPNNDVCFYTDSNFRGASFCLSRWDRNGVANLDRTGFNDKISSIRIPRGVIVTVYEHANYGGQRRDYYDDVYNLSGDFNDIISSISIQRYHGRH